MEILTLQGLGDGMRNLKMVISYDGTDFYGWQRQPNGPTVQEALADVLEQITGVRKYPVASGRTDSGVHALGQVAHWQTESRLSTHVLLRAINANLPDSISLLSLEEVDAEFHAVRCAKSKLYRYVYHDGPNPELFLRNFCWKVHGRLDDNAMKEGAGYFLGTHDFRSFETEWPNRLTSVRTIQICRVARLGDFVYLDVASNGFLYNMVRAFAGTLFEIGSGKWAAKAVPEIITGQNRALAGRTAPAKGLFLVRVEY